MGKINFMRLKFILMISLSSVFLLTSCSKNQPGKDNSSKNKKDKDTLELSNTGLNRYDLGSENPLIITLPKELSEISGITMTPDGRLFAQQDESGIIYQVDLKTGDIIKKFSLGSPAVKEDFEDIVYVNNKFYLLRSKGDIYEFEEGGDGESVEYKIHKTDLNHANDVEGLCYDPETNSLLLACKGESGVSDEKDKAVYSFSLNDLKLTESPRFMLKLSEIKGFFNPSGIQRNPKTGTFFIIAANGNEIIEITKDGELLGKKKLPATVHKQPEGITFGADNSLIISNEGKSGKGYLVIYDYRK